MINRRSFITAVPAAVAAPRAVTGEDAADLTIEQASDWIRRRKLTPAELVQACLARVDRLNPALNAMIIAVRDQALEQARRLKPSVARSPLHGIPVALKDLYDTAGLQTTCASRQYRNRVPTADAEAVRRLKAAGAIVIGKANMDEFAYNFTGETSAYGNCLNPWNRAYSPGGSSGGSAVAVATGMCLGALGSDTGGSIRLPASVCGITGFKPTYGVISTAGAAPLAWSLDHVGPMTKTARDAAIVHTAMAGPVTVPAAKTLRIGIPGHPFQDGMDPEVGAAVEAAIGVLGRLSAGVKRVAFPSIETADASNQLPKPYSAVIYAEAWAFHQPMAEATPELYHPQTLATIRAGASVSAAAYISARREMERLRAAAASEVFHDCDILVMPTTPKIPFELGSNPPLIHLRNTAYFNLLGLPAISIPCGFTAAGMPIGLQIAGPPHRDGLVFAVAEAFQNATDFHRKRPPLHA